jgi:hypothetical protein
MYEGCEEPGEVRSLDPWPMGAPPQKWDSMAGTFERDRPSAQQPPAYGVVLCADHWKACEGKLTRVVEGIQPSWDRAGNVHPGSVLSIELER